jgi:hypothetical protein
MDAADIATWMLVELQKEECLYEIEVVDHLLEIEATDLLRENEDGHVVLGRPVLEAFRRITEATVVWVRRGRYWRFRVPEDEPGREARG